MSDNNGASKFAFFLAGLGMGAILALLFAPQSGKETREFIGQKAEEGRDHVTARGRELRRTAEEWVEKGRKNADELVERGKDLLSRVSS